MEVLGVPSYWAMLIIQNGGVQQAPAANNNQRVFQKDPSTPPAQFHTWSNHGQVCFFLLMLFSLEKRSAKHGRGKRQDFFNQRPHSCTKNAALSETVRNYSASLPRHRDGERPRGLILEVAGLWQMNCRTDFFEKKHKFWEVSVGDFISEASTPHLQVASIVHQAHRKTRKRSLSWQELAACREMMQRCNIKHLSDLGSRIRTATLQGCN
jgi:hypothetical protein